MRTALALLLSFAAVSWGQELKQKGSKRLSSVTWDLMTHRLTWDVQTGREVNGEFRAESTAHYEISPDDAVMQVLNERRGFAAAEAKSLHRLLDTLSLYCAESAVWWDQGQGEKLEEGKPGGKPAPRKPPAAPEPKRERVSRPEPEKTAPAARGEQVVAAAALR
jgi:hypothetical protein